MKRNGSAIVDFCLMLATITMLAVLILPFIHQIRISNTQPQVAKNVVCTKTFEYNQYRDTSVLIAVFKDGGKFISLICDPSLYAKINEDTSYNIKYKKYTGTDTDGYLVELVPID